MSSTIRIYEKQVVPSMASNVRFPSIQFEIKTKEIIYKEDSADEVAERLSTSKNKDILNELEKTSLQRIVTALKNNQTLHVNDKANLDALTRKLLGIKKKKKLEKESVEVTLKRRITATSKSIVIDTVKNDKVIKDESELKSEHLKNIVRKIDEFINREEIKELIFEYFNSSDIEERSELIFQLGLIAYKNPI